MHSGGMHTCLLLKLKRMSSECWISLGFNIQLGNSRIILEHGKMFCKNMMFLGKTQYTSLLQFSSDSTSNPTVSRAAFRARTSPIVSGSFDRRLLMMTT